MRHKQRGAMRSVFWLLGLAAVAVALAMLVGHNQALVTVFWPPYRVDFSFNLLLFCLITGFVVIYAAMRGIAVLRELPLQAQRWRNQQIERSVVGALMDALSNQLSGRFVRAQSSADHALSQLKALPDSHGLRGEQLQVLAHLLIAESAQSLQDRGRRDEHLQAAMDPELARHAPEAYEGVLLRSVRWAVEDGDAAGARDQLALLPQGASRRVQALRLKLRVARLGGATADALDTARLLAKHRAFSPEASRSIVRGLATDTLREAHDLNQLRTVWKSLHADERKTSELALAVSTRANQLLRQRPDATDADRTETATLVRGWLEPVWQHFQSLEPLQQRQLVVALEQGADTLDAAWLARVEQLQRQLPNNAYLQYLAGQTCMQRQLWGKAAQLLGQASHTLKEPGLLRNTWCSLALLAEERGDEAAAQSAWKRAAQIQGN
ncbi:heme biosynthesis protein HemY [Hydrogenophaga sp.]|uniref:heme biosynthesis protein HemY n=1 Tax=Hydrogenophaga sp. TaxID=1904254 RepID=UPI00356B51A7